MSLDVELKDISDAEIQAELVARGGKSQVPYLVDTDTGIEIYESDDIVNHLQSCYGKGGNTPVKPRIHIADNVCVSCEG